MARFRKRPVVIEAEQFQGNYFASDPNGVCRCEDLPQHTPHIHTLEGRMMVSPLDWIITGVKGEKYPCKPDIFEATYEAVLGGTGDPT